MMRKLFNVLNLARKELWSLARDPVMMVLIVYVFTVAIYVSAMAIPETLSNAAIAIVDEDASPLSARIVQAFYPPSFVPPRLIDRAEMDSGMDSGDFTFALNIPPNFQRDVLAGRAPELQLNVDATRMSQAFSGAGYVQQMALLEVGEFVQRQRVASVSPVELTLRASFNPSLTQSWFGSVAQLIDMVGILSIVLTGAALMREREHGTVEHLLAMPVTPGEIMLSKVLAMGAVVLVAVTLSMQLVVAGWLRVPLAGSVALFLLGAALCIYAMTALGIFMATLARSMPQFGMLFVLVVLPLMMLSGGRTSRDGMPEAVRAIMRLAPTSHFVDVGQAILFRGAGLEAVWPQMLAMAAIGTVLFTLALRRFRRTLAQMA